MGRVKTCVNPSLLLLCFLAPLVLLNLLSFSTPLASFPHAMPPYLRIWPPGHQPCHNIIILNPFHSSQAGPSSEYLHQPFTCLSFFAQPLTPLSIYTHGMTSCGMTSCGMTYFDMTSWHPSQMLISHLSRQPASLLLGIKGTSFT